MKIKKIKKMWKRGILLVFLAGMLAFSTGCGREEEPVEEGEAGGYVEEKVELPLKAYYTSLVREGDIVLLADAGGHCLKSTDGGKSFAEEKGRDSVDGWKYIAEAVESPEGVRLLAGRTDEGGYGCAMEAAGGELAMLSGLAPGTYPKPFYGGGHFYILQGSRVYQADPLTGEACFLFEDRGSVSTLAADGKLLYAVDEGGVFLYDLEKGTAAREDAVLSGFMAGKARMTETGGYSALLCPYGDGVYIAVQEGMYWHELYGDGVEQVIGGSGCGMGNVGMDGLGFQGMAAGDSGILVCYSDGTLVRYARGGAIPAQEEEYFRVYSLYRDGDVQKLVNLFRERHPGLNIKYEAGLSAGNGMTREDALKNLSTEMAAGKGPDILVVDELPYESYARKGAFMDLSELRGRMKEEEYFTSVLDAFRGEEGLYVMPILYSIPVLVGDESALAEAESLETLRDLADLIEKADKGQDTLLYNFSNAENLLCLLALSCQGAWVGEDGTLDREAVGEFLTQAERIYRMQKGKRSGLPEEIEAPYWEEIARHSGRTTLERRFGQCGIEALMDKAAAFPGQIFYVGFWNGCGKAFMEYRGYVDYLGDDYCLMPGQKYGTCLPQIMLAVNSNSKHKEEGLEFLEYAFSEEFQSMDSLGGTPVNRNAYLVQQTCPRDDGEACGHTAAGGLNTAISFWLYWPGEEDFRKLDAMLDSITGVNVCDLQVYNAVIEAGQSVLTGDVGVKEAVEEIERKVRLYLAE